MAIEKPHEINEYQRFLISEKREAIVKPEYYLEKLLTDEPVNYLDFGTGLGYVGTLLASSENLHPDSHIYACDYQEDLLDTLWKRITDRKLKNITAFFMPDRSRVYFPEWIPKVNHLILSFTTSTVEDAFMLYETLQKGLKPGGKIHIFDWDQHSANPNLERVFPKKHRLTAMILQQWLELTGYKVEESDTDHKDFFYLRAALPGGE